MTKEKQKIFLHNLFAMAFIIHNTLDTDSKMSTMPNLELDKKADLFEIQPHKQFFYHPE